MPLPIRAQTIAQVTLSMLIGVSVMEFGMPATTAQSSEFNRNQTAAPWYNCLTREVWSPDKQAWCDRVNRLKNMEYLIPEIGSIQLTNGVHEDAATELRVVLLDRPGLVVFGDLNEDGIEDATMLLAVNGGGSGTLVFLVAALAEGDRFQPLTPIALGDRVQVNAMQIEPGQIRVNLLIQGEHDPQCCPTEAVEQVYQIQSQLIRVPD